MRRVGLAVMGLSAALCGLCSAARADGLPGYAEPARVNWGGLYIGYHTGGALGITEISDPFGPAIFGDKVRAPGPLAGAQIGFNWQSGSTVFGLEADASWADLEGTNTCFAFSGFFISSNCKIHKDRFATLTARVGTTLGPTGRTLLYAKGGAAWVHEDATITLNNNPFGFFQSSSSFSKWGWTVGAGVEYALTPHWSVKAEYDFLSFNGHSMPTTPGVIQTFGEFPGMTLVPARTTSLSEDVHQFKLGLNYRFGRDGRGYDDYGGSIKDTRPLDAPGWQWEAGARYWHAWSRFQKDLPAGPNDQQLISRLTYDDMRTPSGELFARLDAPWKGFVKGFIGLGSITSGKMNDEDWCIFGVGGGCDASSVPYSNTVSSVDGKVNYGTIDAGFSWFRGPDYKVGSFIGYNHFTQDMSAFGCTQIANPNSDCVPAIPTSVLVITEKDTWDSLRLGSSAEIMLTSRIRLSAEAAYLPYVKFKGTDQHVLRALTITESGTGRGVQLEANVSYLVTPNFSLGVGGRYWAMWTTSGDDAFNGVPIPRNDTYRTEIYGVTVQGSYKF